MSAPSDVAVGGGAGLPDGGVGAPDGAMDPPGVAVAASVGGATVGGGSVGEGVGVGEGEGVGAGVGDGLGVGLGAMVGLAVGDGVAVGRVMETAGRVGPAADGDDETTLTLQALTSTTRHANPATLTMNRGRTNPTLPFGLDPTSSYDGPDVLTQQDGCVAPGSSARLGAVNPP